MKFDYEIWAHQRILYFTHLNENVNYKLLFNKNTETIQM